MSIKKINKFTDKYLKDLIGDGEDIVTDSFEWHLNTFKYKPQDEFILIKENFKYFVEKSADLKDNYLLCSSVYLSETDKLDVDFKRFEDIENIIKETNYDEMRVPATIGVINKKYSIPLVSRLLNSEESFEAFLNVDWFKDLNYDIKVKYFTNKSYDDLYLRIISFYCN